MTEHEIKQERRLFSVPSIPSLSAMEAAPVFLTKSAEVYQQAVFDWQKEITGFVADRIEQDMRSLQALATERTFPARLKVQQDWFASAMRDYAEEGRKMTEIATRLATGGTADQRDAERAETPPTA